jgi:glycosyltransferase involved in cell wall biosynthesis
VSRPERTLLVIAGEFPPLKSIGRIRTVKFVEHLRAHGWRAVVVTLEPSGREANFDVRLEAEIPEGVTVVRAPLVDLEAEVADAVKRLLGRKPGVPAQPSAATGTPAVAPVAAHVPPSPSLMDRAHALTRHVLKHFVYIPDDYRRWARQALGLCREICRNQHIDAVYTTLPPFSSAFVGQALKRETGLPWVVDYRDLWYGDVLREWLPAWRTRLELRMERRLLRDADVIVTVSEPKTAYMRRLHPAVPARWETLTNGYDDELYGDRARTRPFDTPTLEFVYTGRLFKNRRGYAFAEALGRLHRSDPDLASRVVVRILGGVEPVIRATYDEILQRHGIAHLYRFEGDVDYHAAMSAQVNCDYLLLIVDTGETSDGVIPGKLFEYVAARRPIFALCDPGATQQIIERAGLGRAVPAEDADACEALLRDWLSRPVPETVAADEDYLRQFDRKVITERFARLLDETVEQAGRR